MSTMLTIAPPLARSAGARAWGQEQRAHQVWSRSVRFQALRSMVPSGVGKKARGVVSPGRRPGRSCASTAAATSSATPKRARSPPTVERGIGAPRIERCGQGFGLVGTMTVMQRDAGAVGVQLAGDFGTDTTGGASHQNQGGCVGRVVEGGHRHRDHCGGGGQGRRRGLPEFSPGCVPGLPLQSRARALVGLIVHVRTAPAVRRCARPE